MKSLFLFAIFLCLFSLPAQADRFIFYVTLDGDQTTTVPAGETVNVTMWVFTSGNGANDDWESTSYSLNNSSSICVDTNDSSGFGFYSNNFDITAPSTLGDYDVSFYAHKNAKCKPPEDSNNFTLPDGIIVSPGIAPDISIGDLSVDAGDTANFIINLTSSYAVDITLDFMTSNGTATAGTDYTASNGTVTILAGEISAVVDIATSIIGSGDFTLELSNASAGNITDSVGIATIIKGPDISIEDLSVDAGDTASFIVNLTSGYAVDITLDFLTSNGTAIAGTDYTASNGTVTVLAGETSAVVDIATSLIGSGDFTLTLSNASAGILTDSTAIGTIIKGPDISIEDISVDAGDTVNFIINLTSSYAVDITLDFLTSNGTAIAGTDYTTSNGTVTVLAGETSAVVDIATSVAGSGDFTLTLSNASAGILTNPVATGTIIKAATLNAEYRLEEISWNGVVGEVIDNTGNGINGQSFNGANTNDTLPAILNNPGTCAYGEFDGVDDYLAIEDNALLDLSNSLTITAWVYPTKAGQQVIVSKARRASSRNNYQLQLGAGNTLLFQYISGGVERSISTFTPVPLGTWSHVAVTYTDGKQRFYINGLETDTGNNTGILDTNDIALDIGAERLYDSSTSGVFFFEGQIDEVRIYDGALTGSEVSVVANETHACAITGSLIAEWRMDEPSWSGTGTDEVLDNVGNLDGQSKGAVAENSSPAIVGNPGTCGYGVFDGVNDYIQIADDPLLDLRTELSVSVWIYPESLPSSGLMSIVSKDTNYEFHLTPQGEINWWWNRGSFSTRDAEISPNNWYHIVITYKAGEQYIYVNGVERGNRAYTGGLNVNNNPLQIGQDQGYPGRYFHGRIDEVRVYDYPLTISEVTAIFNDKHGCPASLIAEWRMDELSWNSALGEVIDETGNFNAQAINGANTANSTPAIVGNPGTCGYGTFDGVNDYVAVPASFENQQGNFTITAWIKPSNVNSGSRIFADDENNTQGYAFSLGDPDSGQLRFYSRGVNPISVDTIASVIPTDKWTFVAAVHNSVTKTREIYVNGIAQQVTGGGFSNTYTGTWGLDTGIASIGGETNSGETGNRFTGDIDEVRMYKGALSSAEIKAIEKETHPCDVYIDHFRIDTLDQAGITCQSDQINIKACADASCNTVNPDAVDVVLSINSSAYKTVTVVGSNGTDTSYAYTTVGNAALSLDQTYQCSKTLGTEPCVVDFKDSGFVFSNIPTQISGKASNQAPDDSVLSLQAVKTDTGTGSCVGIFPNGGDIPVNLSYTCDSGTCSEKLTLTNNSNTYDLDSSLSPHILRFGTDSTALFDINYPDAGRLMLNAQKNIAVVDDDGNTVIKDFSGLSGAFVERPFGFFIEAIGNTKAQDASGDKYKKAGEEFSVKLEAVIWESADDQNNDGIPDIGADLSGNNVTRNFGHEAVSEKDTAVIEHDLVAPTPGVLGGLTSSNFTFSNGVATDTKVIYSEVGIINLTANLSDKAYLGTSDVQGNEPFIGRFYPDHFVLNQTNGELAAYCDNVAVATAMPFAYSGQMSTASPSTGGAIRYSLNPSFTITAKTVKPLVGEASTTENYTRDFMKLVENSITRETITQGGNVFFSPIVDGIQDGSEGTKLKLTSNLNDVTTSDLKGDEALGIVTYTYKDADNFVYHHELNAEINLFTADINLPIVSVIDLDDVAALDADDDFDNSGDPLTSVLTLEPTGVEIRFGRAYLENSYGPETSSLPQVLSVEYFKDDKYILADDDICSLYNTDKVNFGTLNEVSLDEANIVSVDGKFDDALEPPNGLTRAIILPAAGTGNRGRVEVIYTIYDWLQYDWDYDAEGVDGLYNDNPRGIATFGIFRGNDRIIYQREIQR